MSPEGCFEEKMHKLGPQDMATQCLGSWTGSGLVLAGPERVVVPPWRPGDCPVRNPEFGSRPLPPPPCPWHPSLFVLSQQLSIEMNGISRGFTSDK